MSEHLLTLSVKIVNSICIDGFGADISRKRITDHIARTEARSTVDHINRHT